ncbi:MAG: hypothetical protein ABJA67_12880 [Chthonomonadales bacterium]
MNRLNVRRCLEFFALFFVAFQLQGRADEATSRFGNPHHLASLEDPRIIESSGIVVSRRTPGIFWTHNDSGDGPYLYAFDQAGHSLCTVTLEGAKNVDWEDIAAGPGRGDKATMYVGDIGDNNNNRTDYAVYRIPEPTVDLNSRKRTLKTGTAEKFPYVYPDGSHDAETLIVDPRNSNIYIVTKIETGISGVYQFPTPLTPNQVTTLKRVGTVKFTNPFRIRNRAVGKLVTAGDMSADGKTIAMRTYTDGFEWRVKPGQSVEEALKSTPAHFDVPWLGQYEALGYSLDGMSLYTTSEGKPCPLWEIPGTRR